MTTLCMVDCTPTDDDWLALRKAAANAAERRAVKLGYRGRCVIQAFRNTAYRAARWGESAEDTAIRVVPCPHRIGWPV